MLAEGETPVTVHRLGDVDEQRVRHGVAAEFDERVDDLLGVVARGPCVPQAERRHPVGVDVLGRALQLGERRDGATAGVGLLVVDFQEQGLVALNNEGPFTPVPFCVPSPRADDRPNVQCASRGGDHGWSSASSATPVTRCNG